MGIEKSEEGIVRCSESKRSIEKGEKEPMFVLIVAMKEMNFLIISISGIRILWGSGL
nr:hypothetical protein [Methanosarcina siciliae]